VGVDRPSTRRRATVAEAADALSIEAARGRIKRGKLEVEREPDGSVFVLLDTNQTRPAVDQATDQTLLIARLENEVQFLREELARKDAIMLNTTEAMKALTPPAVHPQDKPPVAQEAHTEATQQPGTVEPQVPIEGAQEDTQRPWWRRMFG
jgi:hypothetical protein